MRFRAYTIAAAAILTFGVVGSARADEQIATLAVSGDWVALAHHTSITAPPDVCIAANDSQGIAFRADTDTVQLRVINQKWSLPPNVKGEIVATIGSWQQSFDIVWNTDTMVSVNIGQDVLIPMFAAMDRAASMTVVVGKAKPINVSLSGSTKATNAFRTCAGIKSNSPTPGSNPFE